jgi:multidrug efflux pump subunit AcrA (membrane-fusion protein)
LIATSGVERLETRADAVKDLESLAEVTAHWGEPLDHAENLDVGDLPPAVIEALARHIDHSHARRLVAVPVELRSSEDAKPAGTSVVLIAENFGKARELARQRVLELAQLSEPALKQVLEWDRWPIRPVVNWTNWLTLVWRRWGFTRLGVVSGAVALALLSLVLVRTDFEVEAPATLMPRVVQDVFATTDGTVRQVKVAHGEQVHEGTVLAVLDDPQLDLEMERVRGELATVRKRLESIAVARTDRQTRDELTADRLPLSAEAKQLELREASLLKQAEILDTRRAALTLRSPLNGMVLTLDVQDMLRGRPVERGQVLFTVADTNSGWHLETRVPQDRIGHVVTADKTVDQPLTVRFRLAGDHENIYSGHVVRIAETAVLDTAKLGEELPDVRVDVAVDDKTLPAARPEMEAVVRVNCGPRSIGYVWLHDAWDNIYSWLAF